MDAQLGSMLNLYIFDKDTKSDNGLSSGSAPEIGKWQQFLSHYVKVITSNALEDIPRDRYIQFIEWIELMTTHRFHRLWTQEKRFREAVTAYRALYSDPPNKLMLCACRLILFQSILAQFLSDLSAIGMPISVSISPAYKHVYDEVQTFNNQLIFLITRNNKYSTKTSRLVFHPCLDVHAVLSSSPVKSASPAIIAVGPRLIKKLLSSTPCSIFSKKYSVNSDIYDISHARSLLKHALTRSIELKLSDHETFFCLMKTLDTTNNILPIEHMMVKIGFIPETCRSVYIHKQAIEVDGRMLVNVPDTMFLSLTDMLIRDAHTHPAIFCWIARLIDLTMDSSPTVLAAIEGLNINNLRTIPMFCHLLTHQNKNNLNLNFVSFLAKKRQDMTAQGICNEFKSRDSSKLFYDRHVYRLHLTNSLPYAAHTKYASPLVKAYLYLRLIDGYSLNELSFNDIEDLYATIDNPEEFYSRIDAEQYTPNKFMNLIKQKSPELKFTEVNALFTSIELQLIRNLNQAQGLIEKQFVESDLPISEMENMPKEYISLEDPISRARIKTPVRGCSCKHVACFDLETFVTYACETDTWRCPICSELIGLSAMYIDAYQYAMLNYLATTGYSGRKILIDSTSQMPVFSKVEDGKDSILSDWAD